MTPIIPLTRRERVVVVAVLIFVLIGVTVRCYRQMGREAEPSAALPQRH